MHAKVKETAKHETNPVKRFYQSGKKGWRPAINAMCATCVGCTAQLQGKGYQDYLPEGFRNEIRHCAVLGCPIHHLRPYQDKAPANGRTGEHSECESEPPQTET